ncbi:Alpha-amylase [Balamuthia mandrillaris]
MRQRIALNAHGSSATFSSPSFSSSSSLCSVTSFPRLFLLLLLVSSLCSFTIKASPSSASPSSNPFASSSIRSDVVDTIGGRTSVFSLLAGETKTMNDGQYALSSANGVVWHDLDGDGLLNEKMPALALPEVEVRLFWENGTLAATTLTNHDGKYSFKVDPGKYYVEAKCPPDFASSPRQEASSACKVDPDSHRSHVFEISASKAITGINAGCYQRPAIVGTVFRDDNLNGLQDALEEGIPEVQVELRKGTETSFSLKKWTDIDGYFAFEDIEPGEYSLTFISEPRWHHSPFHGTQISRRFEGEGGVVELARTPVQQRANGYKEVSIFLTLLSGEKAYLDQGLFTLSTVEGVVFEDTNADGVWNQGERILPDVKVSLWKVPDILVHQMKSGPDGRYRFTDLEPGEYYVSFDLASPEFKHSQVRG